MALDFLLNDAFLEGFKQSSPMERRATTRFLNRVQDSDASIFNLANQDPDSVHLNDAKVMDAVVAQLSGDPSSDIFADMARRRQEGQDLTQEDIEMLNRFSGIADGSDDLSGLRTKQLSILANQNATGATDAELAELGRTKLGLDLGSTPPTDLEVDIVFPEPVSGYTGEALPISNDEIAAMGLLNPQAGEALAERQIADAALDPSFIDSTFNSTGNFEPQPMAMGTFGFVPETEELPISPSPGRSTQEIFDFMPQDANASGLFNFLF